MKLRQKLNKEANSFLSLVILVVVLIIIAVISENFIYGRVDLTEDKRFTLSDAAVNSLKKLDDIVVIKCIISSELPSHFARVKTQVVDILEEFKAKSNGNLELDFVDPGDDPQKKAEVLKLGVQEVRLQERSNQGVEIKKGFFGIAIIYGEKTEVIPAIQNMNTFEYDIILKIKKLTGNLKNIGIVTGSQGNEFSVSTLPPQGGTPTGSVFDQNFSALKRQIQDLYRATPVNLNESELTVDSFDLVMVVEPKQLSDKEMFKIDQYLINGGSILWMSSRISVDIQKNLAAQKNNFNYKGFLEHYGFKFEDNIILDSRLKKALNFNRSFFPTPYPYWIISDKNSMNANSPVTSSLSSVFFPWVSSISVEHFIGTDHLKIDNTILVHSSKWSWAEENISNLAPRQKYIPKKAGKRALVAMKIGLFNSYFTGRSLADSLQLPKVVEQSTKEGRFLFIPNSLFATDFLQQISRDGSNILFLTNAINQLALDPDLIDIRARNILARPISEESKENRTLYTTFNMLFAPLILSLVAFYLSYRRRKKQEI